MNKALFALIFLGVLLINVSGELQFHKCKVSADCKPYCSIGFAVCLSGYCSCTKKELESSKMLGRKVGFPWCRTANDCKPPTP